MAKLDADVRPPRQARARKWALGGLFLGLPLALGAVAYGLGYYVGWRPEGLRQGPFHQAPVAQADAEPVTPHEGLPPLIPLDQYLRMPDEELLRGHGDRPAPKARAEQLLARLRSVLREAYWPEELPATEVWWVSRAEDAAEAIYQNYAYARYERDGLRVRVTCSRPTARILINGLPEAATAGLAALVSRLRALATPRCERVTPAPEDEETLLALWGQYIRLEPRPMSPNRMGSVVLVEPFGAALTSPSLPLGGVSEPWGVRLCTDGRAIAVSLSSEAPPTGLDQAWGTPPEPPAVEPLNPDDVQFETRHRWSDATGRPTNTPSHGRRFALSVVFERRPTLSSAYADRTRVLHHRPAETYWVHSPGREPDAHLWHACEFHALTGRLLDYAEATDWPSRLPEELMRPQTRQAALLGMRALHADYLALVRWYGGLRVPPSAAGLHESANDLLARNRDRWAKLSAWGESGPEGPDDDRDLRREIVSIYEETRPRDALGHGLEPSTSDLRDGQADYLSEAQDLPAPE